MAGWKNIESAPVDERERRVIENNEQTIVKLMDPDRISRLLMDKGVIDTDDRKQILLQRGLSEKNRMLVGKLLMRGHGAFKNYLNALGESGTVNHTRLEHILQNDLVTPFQHTADEMLHTSRHKRINEKVENHEQRIKSLEEGVHEIRSEEDVESIRDELLRRNTELDELRQTLRTRDGELQEARDENRLLQKRIVSLEKKIQGLETFLKEQKQRSDMMAKQQQQDRRNIRLLEDKNSKLESRLETGEKKMDKKLQDQEKRHHKDMEEIRQLIRDTAKHSSDTSSKGAGVTSRNMAATNSKSGTTGGQQKVNFTPKNRFQPEEQTSKVKANPPAQVVRAFKKSSSDPEHLPVLKPGQKKKQ